MKKFYALIGLVLSIQASAQTYYSEDFTGGNLGAMTVFDVVPSASGLTWVHGVGGGEDFAKMSNYNGSANEIVETWLITPAINLGTATNPALNFDNVKRYSPGSDIKVKVSTNYSGTGSPASATWTDITSSCTLDANTGSWTFVNTGNVDLTSFAGSTIYIAWQYEETTTIGSTWEVDNVIVNEGGVAPPPVLKIYDIQYTTANPADSPYDGQDVTTSGVVTAVWADGIWLQDTAQAAWNGIYVYSPGLSSFSTAPTEGDSLTLTGTVDEFNGLTQLTFISSSTIHGGGYTRAAAALSTTAANAEQWESCLISVSSAVCTATGLTGNQWQVNDGSGALLVDDLMYAAIAVLNNNYDLTGILYYSFTEWKIEPRYVADVIDNSGGAPQVDIYDIQFTTTSPFDSPYDGQTVETGGIVTAIQLSTTTSDVIAFWIQAGSGPYSGLYVYDITMPTPFPAVGDSVVVIGTIDEFNGLTQVTNLLSLNVVSSSNSFPAQVLSTLNGNDEQWESVFVRFEGATVTAIGLPVNQFEINDGSGAIFVDDLLYLHTAAQSDVYNVQGPLYYSFSEWKVVPRNAGDIEDLTSVAEFGNDIKVYPVPASEDLFISGAEGSFIEMISADGQKIYQGAVLSSLETVSLEGIASGLYLIRITKNGQVAVKQIVVE